MPRGTPANPRPGMSIRAFAKLVGVSHVAVVHRINAGQLTSRSVTKDANGRSCIIDVEQARREWEQNADPVTVAASMGDDLEDEDDSEGLDTGSVKHARLRYLNAKADMAEWERDKLRGELMLRTEHRATMAAALVPRMNELMGVVTKVRELLPHLTIGDLEVIGKAIRKALDGSDDGSLTAADLDVLEGFCRDRRAELSLGQDSNLRAPG